jgi:hypothetical protein
MPSGRTCPGCSRLSVVLDSEEVLFGQQLVQPGLVDAADDGGFLVRSRMHLASVNDEVTT